MLKLKVCLTTFEVTVVPCFREYPSNGQHYQLPGNVLVEIPEIKVYDTIIKLYHPTTEAGTGHVDLYIKDIPSGLGIYDHSWTEVHPIDLSSSRIYLWPTGVKSLLKAILALDGFLLKNHGLRLTIQRITLAKFGIGVRKTIPT